MFHKYNESFKFILGISELGFLDILEYFHEIFDESIES